MKIVLKRFSFPSRARCKSGAGQRPGEWAKGLLREGETPAGKNEAASSGFTRGKESPCSVQYVFSSWLPKNGNTPRQGPRSDYFG